MSDPESLRASYPHKPPLRVPPAQSQPTLSVADVVITAELHKRVAAPRDSELEARVLRTLWRDLPARPEGLPDLLATAAREVTGAPAGGAMLTSGRGDELPGGSLRAAADHADLLEPLPLGAELCVFTVACGKPQLFFRPGRCGNLSRHPTPQLYECLCVPITASGGDSIGAVWVAYDCADMHFSVEHVRLIADLARGCAAALELIGSRKDALRRANEAIQAADEAAAESAAKSNFIAALAHEMRNPLMPVLTSVQVLERVAAEPTLAAPVAIIKRQAQRLHRLVEDLLGAARIEHNDFVIDRKPTELSRVVADAAESVAADTEERRQKLNVSLPEGPVRIFVDHTRLCEALANVLENASKYTPTHGQIDIRAFLEGGTLSIVVTDTGIGIPQDMLQRIFGLYSRADDAIAHSSSGLGIGLWVVKRIVQLHGGTVVAESDGPGRGARFTIRLPNVVHGA